MDSSQVDGGVNHGRGWQSPKVAVQAYDSGRALIAVAAIDAGELLVRLAPVFVPTRDRYTIQVDATRHQAGTGEADDFMNHSCDPSTHLDIDRLEVIASRSINPGELITFSYTTTEWELAEPFDCRCGAAACLGRISGFRDLGREQRRVLAPRLSTYLRGRLDDR
jgi:hypothetical protein